MDAASIEEYVRAALSLQGYVLNEEQRLRVTTEFQRFEAIARKLNSPITPDDGEMATIYRA